MIETTTPRRYWTKAEIATLRECWPKGGARACTEHIPTRDKRSIASKAEKLGLYVNGYKHPTAVGWTPFLDKQVRLAYSDPTPGAIKSAAKRLGINYGTFKMHARTIGCVYHYYNQPWKQEESEIVREHIEKGLYCIQRHLKKAGYQRSAAAISSQCNRLGIRGTGDIDVMNANQLARLCGVDAKTVLAWIQKGWLKAKRGEALYTPDPKEDHLWHITTKNFRNFIRDYPSTIDLRKVDQPWFIDVIIGGPSRRELQCTTEKQT